MNKTFYLKIIASDGVFFEGRVRQIIIPAPDGAKGIMANHEDMLIVGQGFAEIVNNRVTLIVETAEKPEDIDLRRAEEQKERAEEQLRQKQSIQEYYHSQASLARAMNRLRAGHGHRWNL